MATLPPFQHNRNVRRLHEQVESVADTAPFSMRQTTDGTARDPDTSVASRAIPPESWTRPSPWSGTVDWEAGVIRRFHHVRELQGPLGRANSTGKVRAGRVFGVYL